jgi:hypothetical protein
MITRKDQQVKDSEITDADLKAQEAEYDRIRQNWKMHRQSQQKKGDSK